MKIRILLFAGCALLIAASLSNRPIQSTSAQEPDKSKPSVVLQKNFQQVSGWVSKSADLVPAEIRTRKKQPYRAPDALALVTPEAESWIEEVASPEALRDSGVFRVEAARQLIVKCRNRAADGQLSNSDNMALVGMLSTQLLHAGFVRRLPAAAPVLTIKTVVDRIAAPAKP